MTVGVMKDVLPEAYPLSTEFVEKNLKIEFVKHSLAKDDAEHLGQDERKASESLEIQQLEVSLLRGILDNELLRLELKKQLRMRVAGDRYVPWLTKMVVQAAVINTIDSLVILVPFAKTLFTDGDNGIKE